MTDDTTRFGMAIEIYRIRTPAGGPEERKFAWAELEETLRRVLSREVAVEAGSLADALRRLVDAHPPLAVHLFDESGGLREHVLCFHNETNTRWLDSLAIELAPGDRIAILQAVSGG